MCRISVFAYFLLASYQKLKKVLTIPRKHDIIFIVVNADVVELADAPDSKSGGVKSVPVRPRSSAPVRIENFVFGPLFYNMDFDII